MHLLSVNTGRARATPYASAPDGTTGIRKEPVDGPVLVTDPGPSGSGGSALAGDAVCDLRHHGGSDQAVYAYAREDLDRWGRELGRTLPPGSFGENLTTCGIDLNSALIGERWRIGPSALLEITSGRIPCRTFQGSLGEAGWVKRFTRRATTGAYLRVLAPGEIRGGDTVTVVHRPDHEVTASLAFRAVTLERELLPELLPAADALHAEALRLVTEHLGRAAEAQAPSISSVRRAPNSPS